MNKNDFELLMAGLGDALSHAKGEANPQRREHKIRVSDSFVAATRRKAGLTQQEFAKVTGASLGTVRKWELGERAPSGAASMLVRIMARAPEIVIEEAGLARRALRRKPGGRAA